MEKEKKNWKKVLSKGFFFIFFTVLGLFGGYYIAPYIGEIRFIDIIYTLFIFMFSLPLHIVLHEIGHILGGFISGYDFIMFRLFNTVWIKIDEGISKRKEYVPGIAGQALMVPSETQEDEQPPFLLYNASGILMNIFTAILFIFIGRVISIQAITHFLFFSALIALLLAITNAIPFQGTDGYNILQYLKHRKAHDEIIDILYMYRDMVRGVSLEELQKYVDLDSFDSFKNPNAATIYTLRAGYLFEIKDFKGARKIYETLYKNLDELFEGHKPVVVLNYLYTLLLTDPTHPEIPKIIQSKAYQQFKQIKTGDYVRIYAGKALYYDHDIKEAERLINEGEKSIQFSPTLTDQKFEETMYQYLKEDLEVAKES
ncbi:M50 family metallopeptidase [Carnobacteriaceae bacterium 52-44]